MASSCDVIFLLMKSCRNICWLSWFTQCQIYVNLYVSKCSFLKKLPFSMSCLSSKHMELHLRFPRITKLKNTHSNMSNYIYNIFPNKDLENRDSFPHVKASLIWHTDILLSIVSNTIPLFACLLKCKHVKDHVHIKVRNMTHGKI